MQLSEQDRELLQQVPEVYHTQINDVLLTALAQALRDWTGRSARDRAGGAWARGAVGRIGSDAYGGLVHEHLSGAAGHEGVGDEGRALKQIKEQLRAVPQRGIGYGVLKYLRGQQGVCALPEPQLLFNYLGQIEQDIADTGLLQLAKRTAAASAARRGGGGMRWRSTGWSVGA